MDRASRGTSAFLNDPLGTLFDDIQKQVQSKSEWVISRTSVHPRIHGHWFSQLLSALQRFDLALHVQEIHGEPGGRQPRAEVFGLRETEEKIGDCIGDVDAWLSLVRFALVQLWIVSSAVSLGASRALPFVSLAALILVALPVARVFERRWSNFAAKSLPSRGLLARYRADGNGRDGGRNWGAGHGSA